MTPSVSPRRTFSFMKLVRRTHMYAGLLLLPWVLLFGVSGLFFNHPNWAAPTNLVHRADGVMAPLDPNGLAASVVEQLNRDGGSFQLVDANGARIIGSLTINARSQESSHTLRLNLLTGEAEVESTPVPLAQLSPPFAGRKVRIDALDLDAITVKASDLLNDAGITANGEPRVRPRPAPELQFQIRDADGRVWNTSCDLVQGQLAGRAADSGSGFDFRTAVMRLHRLHDYPNQIGARWFWTLIADLTGAMMILWGTSGLIMWWQLKPSRLLGALALTATVIVAGVIIAGTIREVTFAPAPPRDAPPPRQRSAE